MHTVLATKQKTVKQRKTPPCHLQILPLQQIVPKS